MPIETWITKTAEYYKVCEIPVYVKPNIDFVLVQLDYMGFYFPKIYFYKFEYIKTILTKTFYDNYDVDSKKNVIHIDLTKDFLEFAKIEQINFAEFSIIMFYLLRGDTINIRKYKKEYQPLIPFFEFLNLESEFLELMYIFSKN